MSETDLEGSVASITAPEWTEETLGYVTNVVARYTRSGSYSQIDAQDIRQHLYLMWYEQAKYVARYLSDKDTERGRAKLLRAMSNWAASYCASERAVAHGYQPEDVFHYSTKQLRSLLPLLAEPTSWTTLAVRPSDGGRQCSAPLAERGDELAVLADLEAGLGKLSDEDRGLLIMRFIETGVGDALTGEEEDVVHVVYEDICELHGISLGAARMRVSRAVVKLQERLGGPRVLYVDHPGRHSMSNAAAQVNTRQDWSGN
jgi:DNA-directed RNA polymerase specialized sigma24 family protein